MTEDNADFRYVDVVPERVSAREVYTYDMKIRANPDIRLVEGSDEPDRSLGEISIDVPYDGYDHFSSQAAERLRGMISGWSDVPVTGQIGWLAVGKPPDWEFEWHPQSGMDLHAVQIPLLNSILNDTALWTADTFRAVIRHEYHPEPPNFIPMRIEMQVYDNAQDSRERFWRTKETVAASDRAKSIPGILEMLDGEPLQGGQLVIALSITAFMPTFMASERVSVVVDQWKFKWPTIAPGWQLKVESLNPEQNVFWRYDPDDQTVELSTLATKRGEPETGSLLVPFCCELLLTLDSPGQVISQDELEGSVRLSIDGCLLSGRQVAWLNASGQRVQKESELLDIRTILKVRFAATLSDQFRHRRTAAYRQWYLPGVRLSPTRLDDIAAALRDIGYKILEEPSLLAINRKTKNGDGEIVIGVVLGQRLEISRDQEPTVLQIEVWALPTSPASTQRKRDIPEGGEVSTVWDTNDLILQARGQMTGPGSLLALDMDELMSQLKSRFNAVADLR